MPESILCFGNNFFGQLGIGTRKRDSSWTPTPFGSAEEKSLDCSSVKDVQSGSQFTTVLNKDGRISICGTLNGMVFPTLSPCEILYPLKCTQIACGRRHILALMEGGFVLSWGTGYFGQLGHGDDNSWDNPKMIYALDPNKLGTHVTSVACGGSHSGAITESGQVFMWGLNKSGQCGIGNRAESLMDPKPLDYSEIGPVQAHSLVCGRSHSAMLTTDSKVYVWGSSSYGRLGISDHRKQIYHPVELVFFRDIQVHSLASGDYHMLALGHDCGVYSWGYGIEGQTGHSSLFHLRNPRRLECFDSLNIDSIACGSSFSMAISGVGYLYAWGYGDGGWLGLAPPTTMPFIEPDTVDPGAILPYIHTRAFDSMHNVLIPQRVKFLSHSVVDAVRCGGAHTIIFAHARDSSEENLKESDDPSYKSSDVPSDSAESVLSLSKLNAEELNGQLISWCRHKKVPFILYALEHGANVNTRDESLNTPLIVAAQNGHAPLCNILVDMGADVNAQNAKGNSSVHYSLSYGFDQVTKILIEKGANDTAVNVDGYTPYELALIARGETEI